MTNAPTPPTPWIVYLTEAVRRAGGVTALARHSHVSASTIHRWLAGEITPERATIGNVAAIARAIRDNPANALRAAGNVADADPGAAPAAPTGGPTLAEELARINQRIEQIAALGLPWQEEREAIATQYTEMDRVIRRHQAKPQAGTEGGDTNDDAAGGLRTA